MELQDLKQLTQRVQAGDFAARGELKHRLEPAMARIVRRVLERGEASTTLERTILAEARRLSPDGFGGSGQQRRTAPVARDLCQRIVTRLWPGATEGELVGTRIR